MPIDRYTRREINDVISVSSIVTVYHIDLRERTSVGDIHDFPEIFYVENGFQTTTIDGIPIHLDAGQIIIYAPNTYHGPLNPRQKRSGTCTVGILSFVIDNNLLAELYNRPITLSSSQRAMYSEIITKGLSLFDNKWGGGHISNLRQTDENRRELQYLKNMLEMFLLDLYSNINHDAASISGSNKENLKQDQMREVTEYMLSRLGDNLTLETISHDLGFSVSKLRRLVYEQKGCGPIAYFINLKIDEAKRLIRKSPMNITEISENLGFSSLHYFSKLFKNKTGRSPSAYAKTIDKR